MDLLESSSFTPPMILLQTVAEEVRHRSLPLHNRLRALAKADDRQVWTFYNEFRSYVFVLIYVLLHWCYHFRPIRQCMITDEI
jgi:exosome complex exonuclease DIS3/RRP44